MNIHEHQAKSLLREFGAPVPNGIVILKIEELDKKIDSLNIFCGDLYLISSS